MATTASSSSSLSMNSATVLSTPTTSTQTRMRKAWWAEKSDVVASNCPGGSSRPTMSSPTSGTLGIVSLSSLGERLGVAARSTMSCATEDMPYVLGDGACEHATTLCGGDGVSSPLPMLKSAAVL